MEQKTVILFTILFRIWLALLHPIVATCISSNYTVDVIFIVLCHQDAGPGMNGTTVDTLIGSLQETVASNFSRSSRWGVFHASDRTYQTRAGRYYGQKPLYNVHMIWTGMRSSSTSYPGGVSEYLKTGRDPSCRDFGPRSMLSAMALSVTDPLITFPSLLRQIPPRPAPVIQVIVPIVGFHDRNQIPPTEYEWTGLPEHWHIDRVLRDKENVAFLALILKHGQRGWEDHFQKIGSPGRILKVDDMSDMVNRFPQELVNTVCDLLSAITDSEPKQRDRGKRTRKNSPGVKRDGVVLGGLELGSGGIGGERKAVKEYRGLFHYADDWESLWRSISENSKSL